MYRVHIFYFYHKQVAIEPAPSLQTWGPWASRSRWRVQI